MYWNLPFTERLNYEHFGSSPKSTFRKQSIVILKKHYIFAFGEIVKNKGLETVLPQTEYPRDTIDAKCNSSLALY